MTEIEIYGTGRKVSIPSSWDEMSPAQVRFVFRLYDLCIRKRISPLEFNVRVLYRLMGIRRGIVEPVREKLFPVRAARKAENVYRLCEQCLAFLFSETGAGKGIGLAFDSLVNPLPEVGCRGLRRLYGPADMLSDLTFGEFRHAAVSLNDFFRTRNPSDLDECIAHLYRIRSRRSNLAGRYVAAVDNRTMPVSKRRVSRIEPWEKTLIMMWFSSCLKYLQSGRIMIDGEEVDMSLLFCRDDDYRQKGRGYSWSDLLIEVAKEQTIGNMERVDAEPLFSIFSIMWHNYKERKRYEKISKAK